jgi:hypothetical protein
MEAAQPLDAQARKTVQISWPGRLTGPACSKVVITRRFARDDGVSLTLSHHRAVDADVVQDRDPLSCNLVHHQGESAFDLVSYAAKVACGLSLDAGMTASPELFFVADSFG